MVLAYVGILYLETQRFFCGLATTIRLGGGGSPSMVWDPFSRIHVDTTLIHD